MASLVFTQIGNLTGPPGSIIFRGNGTTPTNTVMAAAREIDYYLDLDTGDLYPFIEAQDAQSTSSTDA